MTNATNKKILAIGAHPDDVEFGVAGVLIKEIKAGATVKVVVCSLGEAGTNGTPESRKKEAEAAAKFIGAEIEFVSMGEDCHIVESPENTIKLASIIRSFKPNIVLTTSQTENQHPDHLAISHMTRSATRFARYGGLKELKEFPTHNIDALYYYPSSAELDKKPDIVINVSEEYERWCEAMKIHESQMKTKSYLNLVTTKAAALGASLGVAYATGLWVNEPVRVDHLSDLSLSSRNY